MRLKIITVLTTFIILFLMVYRNYIVYSMLKNDDQVIEDPEFTSEIFYDLIFTNMQNGIKQIYTQIESEENVIKTTITHLIIISESLDKQVTGLGKSINSTIRDFEWEVDRLGKLLDRVYQLYEDGLNGIEFHEVYYKSVLDQMQILIDNNKKQLNISKNGIRSKIDKWVNIKKDLSNIVFELANLTDHFNPEIVQETVAQTEGKIVVGRTEVENKLLNISEDVKLKLADIQYEHETSVLFEEILNAALKQLRIIYNEVEKYMLAIDTEIQSYSDSKRDECFGILKRNKEKYYAIKDRIIEFQQEIEDLIEVKQSWVEDAAIQIDKLSRLRVEKLTDKGPSLLQYDETVPFFGIMPSETLASYSIDGGKATMTNYGVRTDGAQFIREITKEEVGNVTEITEIFYDEEGQIISERKYAFKYTA